MHVRMDSEQLKSRVSGHMIIHVLPEVRHGVQNEIGSSRAVTSSLCVMRITCAHLSMKRCYNKGNWTQYRKWGMEPERDRIQNQSRTEPAEWSAHAEDRRIITININRFRFRSWISRDFEDCREAEERAAIRTTWKDLASLLLFCEIQLALSVPEDSPPLTLITADN